MKKMLLSFASIILIYSLHAQQGPLSPSTITTVAIPGSSANWSNTANASVSDDSYTSTGNIGALAGDYSDYLVATNFGFSIPGGAIITGIEVRVERSDANLLTSDYRVRIVKGGSISSTEMSSGGSFPASDSYGLYGSPFDAWGETWTDADVNAADFGVAIAVQRNAGGGSSAAVIDDISITVYYSAVLPVKLVSFTAIKKDNIVELKWVVEEESDMNYYEVERSVNGTDFTSISRLTSRNQNWQSTYFAKDNNPVNGVAYYRLKSVENHGSFTYSKIISINTNQSQSVSIYPTLWKAGTTLRVSNPENAKLTVYFYSVSGKLIGKTSTESNEIETGIISNTVGMVFYKISNESGITVGSGKLIAK